MPKHAEELEVITCKIPVMTDRLTERKLFQLEKLAARDTFAIKTYLQVIDDNRVGLFPEKASMMASKQGLDALTLTSSPLKRKNKKGEIISTPGREQVPYDLKKVFDKRITARELKNCRDTAIELYASHLAALKKHEERYWLFFENEKYDGREDMLADTLRWWMTKRPALPCLSTDYKLKKLPRRICSTTGKLHVKPKNKLSKYWFETYGVSKRKHLWVPLSVSSYHEETLALGTPTSFKVVYDTEERCWYLHIGVNVAKEETEKEIEKNTVKTVLEQQDTVVRTTEAHEPSSSPSVPDTVIPKNLSEISKPVALFSIDFGIQREATTVLVMNNRQQKAIDIRTFDIPEKRAKFDQLDRQIASLQKEVARRKNTGIPSANVLQKLQSLRHTRHQLSIHYDHELTAQIAAYCQELTQTYALYVVMGNLKGIQNSRWKGDGKSRKHRKRLHRWSYQRITGFLCYKLQLYGISAHRITLLKENFTSKRCSKCGSRKTERPCQSFFHCFACGYHQNADINAALNIAFKLISSLIATDEMTPDQWSKNVRALLWTRTGAMAASSTAPSKDETASLVDSVAELAVNEREKSPQSQKLTTFL